MGAGQLGIGRQIRLAIRGAFGLVLVVGGVSVVLAWIIFASVEEGRQRGREVEAIDRIHGLVHHFVSDLHLVLWGVELPEHRPPKETLEEVKARLAAYEALEHAQGNAEARQELARLDALKTLLARLEMAALALLTTSARGGPPLPSNLAVANGLAHEISAVIDELHRVHETKFRLATDRTRRWMILISTLYAGSVVGGVLLLVVGDRFLTRKLVAPISRLAEAALHIAGGDLSRRVPIQSGDEVGQLSRAFNAMAGRLETHEAERVSFEAELERQVKQRTGQLQETTARLQATQSELVRSERIAVTGQIAAGVTHEIRTPLNSLAINLQLLRRDLSEAATPPPIADVLQGLASLEYEINRINGILEEFVNFARLPAPRFADVEIVSLVDEILTFLGPQAAGSGVGLERRPMTPEALVRADRDQIRQVLLNLSQNALQAMPDGGTLAVEVGADDGWVDVALADSGAGVPEARRELIFLPFISTRPGGLGLGLPIVRRIVDEHGGSVTCRDRPGGGTVFTVRLPSARSVAEG